MVLCIGGRFRIGQRIGKKGAVATLESSWNRRTLDGWVEQEQQNRPSGQSTEVLTGTAVRNRQLADGPDRKSW